MTFSLLPDCLAARWPGTLQAIEDAVAVAEVAASLSQAADAVRPDAVHLPGAMRWLSRRVRAVHRILAVVRGLCPERLVNCPAQVGAFRERLGAEAVLVGLRGLCEGQLAYLAPPLGFCPDAPAAGGGLSVVQHHTGPDPPAAQR